MQKWIKCTVWTERSCSKMISTEMYLNEPRPEASKKRGGKIEANNIYVATNEWRCAWKPPTGVVEWGWSERAGRDRACMKKWSLSGNQKHALLRVKSKSALSTREGGEAIFLYVFKATAVWPECIKFRTSLWSVLISWPTLALWIHRGSIPCLCVCGVWGCCADCDKNWPQAWI